jgi:hypothetical protein
MGFLEAKDGRVCPHWFVGVGGIIADSGWGFHFEKLRWSSDML